MVEMSTGGLSRLGSKFVAPAGTCCGAKSTSQGERADRIQCIFMHWRIVRWAENPVTRIARSLAVLNNKSQSKEHIIPNSIGGRRKAGAFICKTCNNKLGETWDAELAKQLNWCALSVGVCRERGEVPKQIVQTIDGRRLWLNNDGAMTPEKPSYNERLVDGQTEISFTARDRREAARMIEGAKRKHPGFNEQKAHNQLEVQHTYLDSPIHMTLGFGGPSAGRSVVKTAWAHASDVGTAQLALRRGQKVPDG